MLAAGVMRPNRPTRAMGGRSSGAIRAIAVAMILAGAIVADLHAQLRTRVYASGFGVPVAFVQDPDDRAVQFVVQQNGRIRVVRGGGAALPTDFIDLSATTVASGEQGLLGLAFPPDSATSRRFFVNFTNRVGDTVVARLRRSGDPLVADPATRFDLRWAATGGSVIPQPFTNHNGGHLAFGPDGYLYIGLGDGGSGNDPGHRAQNPATLLGKMLRIDVSVPDANPSGYQVPPDNPFVRGGPAGVLPEIWSFGLRNPWRYSFDDRSRGGTGALVIGDVGQNQYEEIDYEPPNRGGRNYGWRNREGAHDNVTSLAPAYTPLVEPIHEYTHGVGQSVTGGMVYRGSVLPASFRGRYFFADFVAGRVWSLSLALAGSGEARVTDVTEHTSELSNTGTLGNISSFGADADGELYLVGYSTGRILKIIGPPAPPPVPTGLRIIR
jgi:glucose/arabinose dehydrogenase